MTSPESPENESVLISVTELNAILEKIRELTQEVIQMRKDLLKASDQVDRFDPHNY